MRSGRIWFSPSTRHLPAREFPPCEQGGKQGRAEKGGPRRLGNRQLNGAARRLDVEKRGERVHLYEKLVRRVWSEHCVDAKFLSYEELVTLMSVSEQDRIDFAPGSKLGELDSIG